MELWMGSDSAGRGRRVGKTDCRRLAHSKALQPLRVLCRCLSGSPVPHAAAAAAPPAQAFLSPAQPTPLNTPLSLTLSTSWEKAPAIVDTPINTVGFICLMASSRVLQWGTS